MRSMQTVNAELVRLQKANKNAMDTKTEVALQYIVDALAWVLEDEATAPFDLLDLEEGFQL